MKIIERREMYFYDYHLGDFLMKEEGTQRLLELQVCVTMPDSS
jgi:hypothetical protein